MNLKIRYENEIQTIELDEKSMNEMWVSLSLGDEKNLSQEEKENMIQDAFEEKFNKPEYNNFHKFERHWGNLKKQYRNDDETNNGDGLDSVGDYSQEVQRNNQYEYEDLCQKICMKIKPKYAEVIIAVCLDGMTPDEYAIQVGEKRDNIYKRLQRAKKKIKEIL